MSHKNKFILILILLLSVGICSAIFVRNSIYQFNMDTFKEISSTMSYCPYEDIMYSNGAFLEMNESLDIIDKSKCIVIGKITTRREVLPGAIKTEIKVLKTLKGEVNTNQIYVYEPFDLSLIIKNVFTYEGYNLLQSDKEYILCLTDTIEGTYMFTTPFLAKFPLEYRSEDFLIITKSQLEEKSEYVNYEKYEQLFQSGESFNLYLSYYNDLIQLLNNSQ